MKLALLLTLIARITFAASDYNFTSVSGGLSNKALYEALNIKETIISKKKSKGHHKKKPVVFLITDIKKSNESFECVKTQYSLKKIKSFAIYNCKFKMTGVSFIEKNAVRKNHYFGIATKGHSLEKFIFENTPSTSSKVISITNQTYITKSFGNFRSKKISYDDDSFKPGYTFYIEN